MERLMADFETTTEPTAKLESGKTRVWAWCVVDIDTNNVVGRGINITTFFTFLQKKPKAEVYFHNLKFDGSFIIDWLLKNGFRHTQEKSEKDTRTFNTIIAEMGQFYQIEIIFKKYNKKLRKITIFDSLKKLPFSVKQIAKTFKLPEQKLDIDYDAYRPLGYEPTPEEWQYIEYDCIIVAKALQIQFEKGLDKMTIGSDAMGYFKEDTGKKAFEYLFPVFGLELDNDIRKSYKGGFTYLNPKYRNKQVNGVSYDVNSLYPAVMYGLYGDLPYGIPQYFEGEYKHNDKYPLYIVKFIAEFEIKPNHIPTIQLKGTQLYAETEYLTKSKVPTELTLTKPDYELFIQHYDVNVHEWHGGYMFKPFSKIFRDYIDYWMKIKETSEGGQRQLAKLMLNNLYGKFATNPKRVNKVPYIKDGIVFYKTTEVEYVDPVYTALGSFITAYARANTIKSAQLNYDRFIYADTDSIYLEGYTEPDNIEVHNSHLGMWKCEGTFDNAIFLRAKTYIKEINGHLEVKCAGMPEVVKQLVTRDNFKLGSKFKGKLLPKRVEGGVILLDTEFTIKR